MEVDNRPSSRPSLEQIIAVVDFMHKHEDLTNVKLRKGFSREKAKKLWTKLSKIANSIPGTTKTTQGWIRFWIDKKSQIKAKKKNIDVGRQSGILTPIEEKIWKLCFQSNSNGTTRHINAQTDSENAEALPLRLFNPRKIVKQEVSYVEEDSSEDMPLKKKKTIQTFNFDEQPATEVEERQLAVMEKLVLVMDKQATALSQMAQSSHSNAQAMERLAEAAQIQALAIERLASSFENIGAAVHDVRNAIINIDYTMKRSYTMNQT